MKTLSKALILVAFAGVLNVPAARAAVLPGYVTGHSMLGCVLSNYTGVPQIIDRVQYQYVCNHGPQDPFHLYLTTMPCFGNCQVENGRTFWHTNGPFTYNCILMSTQCQGHSRPAPTPTPSPAELPTDFTVDSPSDSAAAI